MFGSEKCNLLASTNTLNVSPSPQNPPSSVGSTLLAAARDPRVRAQEIGGAESEEHDPREEQAVNRSGCRRTDPERNPT